MKPAALELHWTAKRPGRQIDLRVWLSYLTGYHLPLAGANFIINADISRKCHHDLGAHPAFRFHFETRQGSRRNDRNGDAQIEGHLQILLDAAREIF